MIFLVQLGINMICKFFKDLKLLHSPYGFVQFCQSLKNLLVLIYSKLYSKSCDYLHKQHSKLFKGSILLLVMFVRPKMGYVRAKIGLTGQFDRRQPGNYLQLRNGESESSSQGSSPSSYKKIKMFTDFFHSGKFSV